MSYTQDLHIPYDRIADFCHKHRIRKLSLFGSALSDDFRSDSDVDVLVEFTPGSKTFDNFCQLAGFLEAHFGRRVELITLESLSPFLGPQILSELEYVTFDAPIPAAHPQ